MLFWNTLLQAFSNNIFKVSHYRKNQIGDTVVFYTLKNKRMSQPYRMLAKDIVLDTMLRKNFDYSDYTEIVTFAQRDSILEIGDINKDLMSSYQKARRTQYLIYPYLVALTAAIWCFAAILGHRFMYLQFDGYHVDLPGAIIIFPVIYFMADLIQEVYGYARARQTLWVCIFTHVILGTLTSLVMQFNPAPFVNNAAYEVVLGPQWAMILGNAVGMIAGFTINGYILAKLKIRFEGRYLWLRTISSTFIAEFVYSFVCSFIAFHTNLALIELIKLQFSMVLFKSMWEVIMTPFLYLACSYIKEREGMDVFDHYANFNPFSMQLSD